MSLHRLEIGCSRMVKNHLCSSTIQVAQAFSLSSISHVSGGLQCWWGQFSCQRGKKKKYFLSFHCSCKHQKHHTCVTYFWSQCIEGVIGGTDYNQNKVNQWTASIVEHSLTQLVKQGRPFKYIGKVSLYRNHQLTNSICILSTDQMIHFIDKICKIVFLSLLVSAN